MAAGLSGSERISIAVILAGDGAPPAGEPIVALVPALQRDVEQGSSRPTR